MSKKVLIVLIILLLVGFGLWFFFSSSKEENKALEHAKVLTKEGKYSEAVSLIKLHQDQFSDKPGKDEWLLLYIEAIQNYPQQQAQLANLYKTYPAIFNRVSEEAALQTASSLLYKRDFDNYEQLKKTWSTKTQTPALWEIVETDKLIALGLKTEAYLQLNSLKFTGKPEVLRRIRLAFLLEKRDPEKAWENLLAAAVEDPKNPDIRSLKAALLEKIGRTNLALVEYKAAVELNPDNPLLWDQLARYYIRQANWTEALLSWQKALKLPYSESIWIHLWFWSKVVRPLDYSVDLKNIANSPLKSFINYLHQLPSDKFWDAEKFKKLDKNAEILQTYQETFWLRLLQSLQDKDYKQSFDLIAFNPFRKTSFRPDLERAIALMVQYKLEGNFLLTDALKNDLSSNVEPSLLIPVQNHQLMRLLDIDSPPTLLTPSVQKLFESSSAFSVLLASGGWFNASLNLHFPEKVSEDWPTFVSFTLTQAIRVVKGNDKAIEFALKQPKTDDLDYLIGELYSSVGKEGEAEKYFDPLIKKTTPAGIKAAWSLVLIKINEKDYEGAELIIRSNAALKDSVLGKELNARIAVLNDKPDVAFERYSEIRDRSYEAKAYIAEYYINHNQWNDARKIVTDLKVQFPENPNVDALYQKVLNHFNQ